MCRCYNPSFIIRFSPTYKTHPNKVNKITPDKINKNGFEAGDAVRGEVRTA